MTPAQLINHLKTNSAQGVYLVVGTETYLKDGIVKAIRESVLAEENEWNQSIYDSDKLEADALVADVSNMPFFGSKRLVMLRDVEKLRAADADKITDLMEDLPTFTVLVLLGGEVDRRKRLWKACNSKGTIVECFSPKPEQLPRWLNSRVQEMGYQIAPGAVNLLTSMFKDLNQLNTELDKLISYKGSAGKITEADVNEVVSLSAGEVAEYAIFDFVDGLAENRIVDALGLLEKLLTAGREPLMILGMIARQFRLILRAHGIRTAGGNVDDIKSQLGVHPFVARKLWQQIQSVSVEEAARAVWLCYTADRQIKTGANGGRTLELIVVQMQQKRP